LDAPLLKPLAYSDTDEERRLQSVVVLLTFGARRLWQDGAGRTVAECGKANGQHRLAELLEHWGGAQVQSLDRLRGGGSGRRPGSSANGSLGSPLLSLPDVVVDRIANMVAPGLRDCQAMAAMMRGGLLK
jgi:hypothetical protein